MTSKERAEDSLSYFTNKTGRKIACRYWKPRDEVNAKALVFINHGAGEHSGWYAKIAEPLADLECLVCAHDHVGHGMSEGDRVHVEKIEDYVDDLRQHMDMMCNKHPNLPVFVIGHSMGGTISLSFGFQSPNLVKGMVLIGPAVIPNPETSTLVKRAMAKFVAYVVPQFQVGRIEPKWVSRDQNIIQMYEEDPLNWHGGLKARWAVEMLRTMYNIQANVENITWPIFVLHGSEDKLCEISGSRLINEQASSSDNTLKVYPGGYHQVHNEPEGQGEEAVNDITQWIKARL